MTHLQWPGEPSVAHPKGGEDSQGGILPLARCQRHSTAQCLSTAPSGFQQLVWGTGQLIPPAEDPGGEGAS